MNNFIDQDTENSPNEPSEEVSGEEFSGKE